jgi:hypothetical protein
MNSIRMYCLGLLVLTAFIATVRASTSFAADQALKIADHPKGTESFVGGCPSLSPNGRLVAVRRYVPIDLSISNFDGSNAMREDLWIRDLKTGKERLIREDCRALEWLDDNAVALDSNEVIEPNTSGARRPKPERRRAVASSNTLSFGALNGTSRQIPLGHMIVGDIISKEKGFLWVSPGGSHVAFDLLFLRRGDVPIGRIGVAQVDTAKVTYVGELAYCHYNWGYQAQERCKCKTDPWTRSGSGFAFVSGRGDGEAILNFATATGSQVLRLADDESCKWSPVFDPTGSRLAYFAAEWGGETGTLLHGHVRVLDLYTGAEQRFAPAGIVGSGLAIAWSRDGSELIHDWYPGTSPFEHEGTARTYRVKMTKSKPVPSAAVIKAIPVPSQEDELVAAILSKSSARVSWGIKHATDAPTQRVKTAMCTALSGWFPREVPCAGEIVHFLTRINSNEAIPLFRKAILIQPEPIAVKDYRPQYQPNAVCEAIAALMKWRVRAAAAELHVYLQRFPDSEPAVYAIGALAAFGEQDRWRQLATLQQSRDKEIRSRLTVVLSMVRDPRSVDILLDMVDDHERLYISVQGETQVGDKAVDSLKKLTSHDFGRDVKAWRAWWAKQDRELPVESNQ